VSIDITVNSGTPDEHPETVTCPVTGFSGFTLSFNADWTGDVSIVGDGLNLNGNNLSVSGNLIHQAGWLILNGGSHLNITGDYLQQCDENGDGAYESNCHGQLSMSDADDYMLVEGRVQFWSDVLYNTGIPSLRAGTLVIQGDFEQRTASDADPSYRYRSFRAAEIHVTKFSGSATQTVTFQNPGYSFFNILEVTNPHPLVFGSPVVAARVTGNATIAIESPGEGGISGTIESNVTFAGNAFTMISGTDLGGHSLTTNCPVKQVGDLNLSGGIITITGAGGWDQRSSLTIGTNGRLTVPGNYIHQAGWLILNGGHLYITGAYLQQSDENGDGIYESNCHGQLSMSDVDDYMLVGGRARFWSDTLYNTGIPSLRAGTLEIEGDFEQKTASDADPPYRYRSFRAAEIHVTKFSGSATQTVTFQNPGYSFFNILKVTNPHLAGTSTIPIADGGNMQLNYIGTDVIAALYINETPQANGLYDFTNANGLITGTGRIQVGPFASFSAWADANAPGQSMDQDHNHDGVPNGIEYFMGKTGSDFTANPGISPDGTVTWPKSPAFSGSYAVQTSADLVEWTDVTEDATQVTKNADSVVWTRPTGPDKCFVRLLVTPN